MTQPTFSQMLRVFGRIGVLSFGGPAAQIALMHKELVETRDWLDEQTFLRALSLCMLLPGPEAMQLATYAGWRLRGTLGGLLAGLLFVLPGAAVIAVLVALYVAFGQVPLVQAAFLGIKAAVIIIVLQALLKVSRKALGQRSAWVIAGLAFVAIFAFDLPFPLIIALAGVWGYMTTRGANGQALPPPAAARPVQTVLLWGGLWMAPLVALSLAKATFLAETGWFFARLAVVTFGGAYAVLGYMTQTVVQDYGWISTAQMIDALGLAETTPGPLILVTQFVAMLSGQSEGGATLALAAGLVALWATFMPCFLWIFLAGPYLERIAARPRLSGALNAITAAVVGVILNLSVWFALHVLFARVDVLHRGPLAIAMPDWASLNLWALALTVLAGLVFLVAKRGMGIGLAIMAFAGIAVASL
ncbi:chromate efflux transporter [Arenibacterium sp. CAU 1754]